MTENQINTHEHPLFGRGRHRINAEAVNHDMRRKLWDGQLPLKINIYDKEVSTSNEVRSMYIMVPRLNYFTFILDQVKANFDEYVPADLIDSFSDMYFEHNKKALKWDVPIGVQFDTIVGCDQNKSRELPWSIIFHYKGNNDNDSRVKLQKNGPVQGIKYIEFNFINSIKESHVLRMGSANEILAQMKKYEEEKLLDGVQKHDYTLFWEINQPLNDKHIADMRKFAVRIYSNCYQNFVQPNLEIEPYVDEAGVDNKEDLVNSEKFIEWEQSNYDLTLGSMLLKSFPRLFQEENGKITQKKEFSIICHGLKIDINTPLYWLQVNMSYLDNFIYLSFHTPQELF